MSRFMVEKLTGQDMKGFQIPDKDVIEVLKIALSLSDGEGDEIVERYMIEVGDQKMGSTRVVIDHHHAYVFTLADLRMDCRLILEYNVYEDQLNAYIPMWMSNCNKLIQFNVEAVIKTFEKYYPNINNL